MALQGEKLQHSSLSCKKPHERSPNGCQSSHPEGTEQQLSSPSSHDGIPDDRGKERLPNRKEPHSHGELELYEGSDVFDGKIWKPEGFASETMDYPSPWIPQDSRLPAAAAAARVGRKEMGVEDLGEREEGDAWKEHFQSF
ncbi:hypothetical protein MA16_Dca015770 [Dendrobium catenatum]|uniref:Uncharacterized protein n=1 Tax=Dendrobium catenatum TaxID=906689 RepID=A0A2I0WS33_9ASPA|nr:hypothetical protein MA16_Dca015770 [Dendrobium catenatum]